MVDASTFPNAKPSLKRTPRGATIDRNEERESASDSIRVNRESDSNETAESDLHAEKHFEQRTSTVPGIKIDRSEEP
jgi:hypothetical protein